MAHPVPSYMVVTPRALEPSARIDHLYRMIFIPYLHIRYILFIFFQIVSDLNIRETSEATDDETVSIFGQVMVASTVLDKLEAKIPMRK